jgi:tetratricopeptide (TPR) repeat protein
VDASEGAGRGASAVRAKAVDTGVTLTRRATQLDPARAGHWFALGQALEAARDTAGARAAYLEATRRRPDELPFWWGVSRTNIDLAAQGVAGAAAAAVDAAERGIAADGLDPNGYDQLARAQLLAAGDNAGALDSARRAIALYARDPGYYLVAAEATRRAGDVAGSIAWLRQGVAATEDTDLRLNLARALIATAQPGEARAVLEALLRKDPANVAALDLIRQLPAP